MKNAKMFIIILMFAGLLACIQEREPRVQKKETQWATIEKDGISYRATVIVLNDERMKFHWDRGEKFKTRIRSKRLSTVGQIRVTFDKLTMVNHLKYKSDDGRLRDRWNMKVLLIDGPNIMCVESHESPTGKDEPETRVFKLQPGDWLTFLP